MPFRVKLLLIAESDRFQRKDGFARFVHRLDCLLKPHRGGLYAKLTADIDPDRHAGPGDRHSVNTGDKGVGLRSLRADPDRLGLARNTTVADIDIVVTCEIQPASSQCDIDAECIPRAHSPLPCCCALF